MYWHSPPKASGLAATAGALLLTAGAVALLLLLLLTVFPLPRSAVAVVATLCAALAEKSQQKKPHLQQLCPNLAASCQQPQRQQNAAKNPKNDKYGQGVVDDAYNPGHVFLFFQNRLHFYAD